MNKEFGIITELRKRGNILAKFNGHSLNEWILITENSIKAICSVCGKEICASYSTKYGDISGDIVNLKCQKS